MKKEKSIAILLTIGMSLSVYAEDFVIIVSQSYEVSPHRYISSEKEMVWSSWSNVGSEYDCSAWSPLASSMTWGDNFNQSELLVS